MVQKVLVRLVDDRDGSDADETVQFGLDGMPYEIDLSSGNAGELRSALTPYITRGRKLGRTVDLDRRRPGAPAASAGRNPHERARSNAAVRRWAADQGYQLGAVGRIPARIVEAYERRHQAPASTTERPGAAGQALVQEITFTAAAPEIVFTAAGSAQAGGRPVDPLAYSSEVRQWAKANGRQVGETGRLAGDVIDAYRNATARRTARQASSGRRRPAKGE